jgi:hypothetical protein
MAAVAVVVAEAVTVVVGEVGVTVMRDPLHVKGGNMVAALMDHRRNDASTMASPGTSPGNAGPRKSRPKQIWPRRRSMCSCWLCGRILRSAQTHGRVKTV